MLHYLSLTFQGGVRNFFLIAAVAFVSLAKSKEFDNCVVVITISIVIVVTLAFCPSICLFFWFLFSFSLSFFQAKIRVSVEMLGAMFHSYKWIFILYLITAKIPTQYQYCCVLLLIRLLLLLPPLFILIVNAYFII